MKLMTIVLKWHITFKAWRSAGNSIPSARTVVDYYLKFKIKFFVE